jgi:hypothetical protein
MKFLVGRTSQGVVSREPPCPGAIRGAESAAWPGEYEWYVELNTLDDLMRFLHDNGGGLGLWAPEEGEEHPALEIFDDDQGEEA